MTLFDWILLGLIIAALITIGVLVSRKWKKLLLVDVDAMPDAKLRNKKYQLIEGRLNRKTDSAIARVQGVVKPVTERVNKQFNKLYGKVQALERKYRHQGAATVAQTSQEKEKTRQKIASMVEDGLKQFKEGNLGEAEQSFMDVIRLNPREVEAYEYLGEVYLEKKEYEHAIETLEFAKKLNADDDRVYYDLGMVYREIKEFEKAVKHMRTAIKLAPKNPKNLNGLVQIAIDKKDKYLAVNAFGKLRKADPENGQLENIEKKIDALPASSEGADQPKSKSTIEKK